MRLCFSVVRQWQLNEKLASQSRNAVHERLFGERLTESTRLVAHAGTPPGAHYTGIWSPFDYWEPTISCAEDVRIPMGLVGDGAKWVCGVAAHTRSCRVLSLGSNFDDNFERAIFKLAGCSSYIVDPTLIPRDRNGSLGQFLARLRDHGSVLNGTVGAGVGSGLNVRLPGPVRREEQTKQNNGLTHFASLVSLRQLLLDRYQPPVHLAFAKFDIEGAEYSVLAEMGVLCTEGILTVDQLNVEVHRAPRRHKTRLSEFTQLFRGARQCGLMIHHKERNNWARGENEVVEYAWVSPLHAARAMNHAMNRTLSSEDDSLKLAAATTSKAASGDFNRPMAFQGLDATGVASLSQSPGRGAGSGAAVAACAADGNSESAPCPPAAAAPMCAPLRLPARGEAVGVPSVLPCALATDAAAQRGLPAAVGVGCCAVQPLPRWLGYQTALLPMRDAGALATLLHKVHPTAAWLAVTRVVRAFSAHRHSCNSSGTVPTSGIGRPPSASATDLLVLSSALTELQRWPLPATPRTKHKRRWTVLDARMLGCSDSNGVVAGGGERLPLLSFYSHVSGDNYNIAAQLSLGTDKAATNSSAGGVRKTARDGPPELHMPTNNPLPRLHKLLSERNAGLIMTADSRLLEIVHSAPALVVHEHLPVLVGPSQPAQRLHARSATPAGFPAQLHNSINPLWLPELGEYLCLGHHYTIEGGLRHYHHVFWTLDASARRIGSFSPPFVLPSLPGQILEPKRLVQFPMSATYIGERVVVAYGTDDCFSAAVTFDLALIMALLRVPGLRWAGYGGGG